MTQFPTFVLSSLLFFGVPFGAPLVSDFLEAPSAALADSAVEATTGCIAVEEPSSEPDILPVADLVLLGQEFVVVDGRVLPLEEWTK